MRDPLARLPSATTVSGRITHWTLSEIRPGSSAIVNTAPPALQGLLAKVASVHRLACLGRKEEMLTYICHLCSIGPPLFATSL